MNQLDPSVKILWRKTKLVGAEIGSSASVYHDQRKTTQLKKWLTAKWDREPIKAIRCSGKASGE